MENLSDTYHDPSQRVPKNYYWNADNKNILFSGDLVLCSQHYYSYYIYIYIIIYLYTYIADG